ncbi:ATP-binding cassette domain-containing protein [Prosthecomicrobium hirschii]|uniref:ATP-binding cassette domain-containing protein n=1 Tax=Prosthecodimorpha hirschii TaxID=665126 RepID=UPI00221E553F|nr:ATP-binding cassette domain-containing protein [Prosthecomicrobium hirschii]
MTTARRWFAPEVVQTSVMDCGPAALKCVLEGFRIPVSYGRLREACRTDVDGTSIDALEVVANDLGIGAEQQLLPADHVMLNGNDLLPALVVVARPGGATHFVVVWRRVGGWLQVMDPAVGRRWVPVDRFAGELFRHETSVLAADWRGWASTEAFLAPLRHRLHALGGTGAEIDRLIALGATDPGWFAFGALDAAVRLVASLIAAGGIAPGEAALGLVMSLHAETLAAPTDIHRLIAADYWSVVPDAAGSAAGERRVMLRGAVLVQFTGPRTPAAAARRWTETDRPLSPDLAAALADPPARPFAPLLQGLREDGLTAPLALAAATLAAGAVAIAEALLFRGLIDIGEGLALGSQRAAAAAALLVFLAIGLAIRYPLVTEALRFGRAMELRLRLALFAKLPRLDDRYFQSRPVSDMADRAHAVQLARSVPSMALHGLLTLFELLVTLAAIAVLDPASAPIALLLAGAAALVPVLLQPILSERDARLRIHGGALAGFYLDALLGLVPIRAHRAEAAVRQQHEGLLLEWSRSARAFLAAATLGRAVQSLVSAGLAAALLVAHFQRLDGVAGSDLLLVYWTLKLPALGGTLTLLSQRYPAQRNMLLRLMEPLSAPEPAAATATAAAPAAVAAVPAGVAFRIEAGRVAAAGHTILSDLDLVVAAGEQIAVVGPSGAGKSSLIGLLLGWHRLAAGRLIVDGRPAGPADVIDLRRRIAWVDPAVQIWNRSLVENLAYATDMPDTRRMIEALDAAELRDLLGGLPDGLQTALGEGGALLSGGQGQRVRLARAFAQNAVGLALLDEPFRGLDRRQRSELLGVARRHWAGTTLICATHDVADTLGFDRVLVVENGRIVEDGAPDRLASTSSRYRDLLDAEARLRERLWRNRDWRRIRIQNGRIHPVPAGLVDVAAEARQANRRESA